MELQGTLPGASPPSILLRKHDNEPRKGLSVDPSMEEREGLQPSWELHPTLKNKSVSDFTILLPNLETWQGEQAEKKRAREESLSGL